MTLAAVQTPRVPSMQGVPNSPTATRLPRAGTERRPKVRRYRIPRHTRHRWWGAARPRRSSCRAASQGQALTAGARRASASPEPAQREWADVQKERVVGRAQLARGAGAVPVLHSRRWPRLTTRPIRQQMLWPPVPLLVEAHCMRGICLLLELLILVSGRPAGVAVLMVAVSGVGWSGPSMDQLVCQSTCSGRRF